MLLGNIGKLSEIPDLFDGMARDSWTPSCDVQLRQVWRQSAAHVLASLACSMSVSLNRRSSLEKQLKLRKPGADHNTMPFAALECKLPKTCAQGVNLNQVFCHFETFRAGLTVDGVALKVIFRMKCMLR